MISCECGAFKYNRIHSLPYTFFVFIHLVMYTRQKRDTKKKKHSFFKRWAHVSLYVNLGLVSKVNVNRTFHRCQDDFSSMTPNLSLSPSLAVSISFYLVVSLPLIIWLFMLKYTLQLYEWISSDTLRFVDWPGVQYDVSDWSSVKNKTKHHQQQRRRRRLQH